ncbi:hypothetical protein PIIN_10353 [Serendipita indica DSM 11827]|uniref:Uncharacterized protein n=1 Tax=Serendipita indica (strain DSM 11827) TaxID=1109443 RepID=G4TYG7_SERID|nr:hypothetical protein PIIN_10353 [Serendipita indica DSM 11827]
MSTPTGGAGAASTRMARGAGGRAAVNGAPTGRGGAASASAAGGAIHESLRGTPHDLMTRYVERHTILCVLEEAHRMNRSDGRIRTWIRMNRRPKSDGCGIAQSVEAKRAKVVVEAQIVRIRAGIVIGWNVKGEVRLNPDACAIQCLGAEADDPAWLSSRQA